MELVVVLVVVGIAVVRYRRTPRSGRPEPRPLPTLARRWVIGLALLAAVLLLVSVGQVWWTVEDYERQQTLVTRGTSAFPLVIVGLGLLSVAGAAVAAARGWRNLVVPVFWLTWVLVAWGWFESTGEPTDSDAGGVSESGLDAVTCAMLVATIALLVVSLTRLTHRLRVDHEGTA
jgi:hypothetical protein